MDEPCSYSMDRTSTAHQQAFPGRAQRSAGQNKADVVVPQLASSAASAAASAVSLLCNGSTMTGPGGPDGASPKSGSVLVLNLAIWSNAPYAFCVTATDAAPLSTPSAARDPAGSSAYVEMARKGWGAEGQGQTGQPPGLTRGFRIRDCPTARDWGVAGRAISRSLNLSISQ